MPEEVGTRYILDISNVLAGFDKMATREAEMREAMMKGERARQATFQQLAQQSLEYQRQLQQNATEIRNANLLYKEQREQLRAMVQESRELEKQVKRNGGESTETGRKLTAELKRNQAEQQELTREIAHTRKAIDDERLAQIKLRAEQQGSVAQQKLATAAAQDTAAAQKKATAAAKEAGGATAQAGKGGFFSGLLAQLGGVTAGLFTVSKLTGAIRQGLNDFAEISGIQATFKTLTGSATEGAKEFAFVRAEANRFGLELPPIARSYAALFAAAKEANLPLEQTRELFQGVSAASKVFNLSSAETEQALRAVQQMLSKGTVSSQELKLQLGNVLPGAFALAAKAANLTTQELSKQLEQGKIIASDFLPKFAKQLKETYGSGTEDAANSVRSNLGRINTFFTEQSAQLGAAFAPLIAKLAAFTYAGETAAQKAERTADAFFQQAQATRTLETSLPALLARYTELSTATDGNKEKQQELRTVIDQIAAAVPGAVTAFDQYGKALGINGAAVEKFIQNNSRLTKLTQDIALREGRANLTKLIEERKFLTNRLNSTEEVDGIQRLRGPQKVRIQRATGLEIVEQGDLLTEKQSDAEITKLVAQSAQIDAAIAAQTTSLVDIIAGRRRNVDAAEEGVTQLQGLIEKQKKLIEDLRKRQEAATQENQGKGTDFLFGKGGLNAQLEAAQKELDRLLGKVEKDSKQRENALQTAMKQLLAAREKLRAEGRRIELERLREDGKALAAEQLKQDLLAVSKLEEAIKAREDVVKKKGGKGADADGILSASEQEEINKLTADAKRRFDESIEQIDRETNARLLNLQKESDAKEIAQLEAKFAEELRIARRANNLRLVEGLEAARLEQLAALRQAQALRAIDSQEQLRVEAERRNKSVLPEAGISVTADQSDSPGVAAAKQENIFRRLLANAAVDIERDKQKRILKAQIDFNNERLRALQNDFSEEGIARKIAIQNTIDDQQEALTKLGKTPPFDILKALGVPEEKRSEIIEAINNVANSMVTALSEIFQADQRIAENKANNATTAISELQSQLTAEIALRKEGSASNIANLREQINEQRKIRREAVEDQRRAAKAQVVVDTLTQGSSVATAAAQALAAFSGLGPVGFILGIAAATTIVGAFAAAKVKAFEAAGKVGNDGGGGFFKGGYTGGSSIYEERGVVHGQEFVHTASVTDKYRRPLFEALHNGRPQDIDWQAPHMQALLPDFSLPEKLRNERAAVVEHRHQVAYAPLQAGLDGLASQMKAIEKNTARLPREQYVNNLNGSLLKIDLETGNRTTYRQA